MASYLNQRHTQTPTQQGNPTQQLANMINQFKGMGNPQSIVAMLGQKNPQAAQRIQALMQSGGNPQQIVMQELQNKGIDFNQLMSMIK